MIFTLAADRRVPYIARVMWKRILIALAATSVSLAHATVVAPPPEAVSDAQLTRMIEDLRAAAPSTHLQWHAYMQNGGLVAGGAGLGLTLWPAARGLGRFLIRWGLRVSIAGLVLDLVWPDNNTPDDEFSALLKSESGLEGVLRHSDAQILALADRDRAFRITLIQTYQALQMVRASSPR